MNHFHKIQGYADVLTANVQHLLSEGSGEVFFVTVTMRCRNAEGRVVGGSLHLVCHAPVDKVKVYAAFTPTRLQSGQTPADLPWQLVSSSRDYGRWAEQGIRASLVSACSDIEARAVDVLKMQGSALLSIEDMGLLRYSEVFERDARDLLEVGCVDVSTLLEQWTTEVSSNTRID